jgi:hypothetical protein
MDVNLAGIRQTPLIAFPSNAPKRDLFADSSITVEYIPNLNLQDSTPPLARKYSNIEDRPDGMAKGTPNFSFFIL